jgi:hypothetical protein
MIRGKTEKRTRLLVSKVQVSHLDWSILLKIPMFQSNTFQLIDIEKELVGKKRMEKERKDGSDFFFKGKISLFFKVPDMEK